MLMNTKIDFIELLPKSMNFYMYIDGFCMVTCIIIL
jgi:hypothetical protein